MAFNPLLPADGSLINSAELRSQFTGLKSLIDAVPVVTGTAVDSVTLGGGTSVSVALIAGILHFDFLFQPGPPGEVTQAQLSNDLSNAVNQAMLITLPQTSANTNGVALLGLTVSDPPTQAEMQSMANKLDGLINAARR